MTDKKLATFFMSTRQGGEYTTPEKTPPPLRASIGIGDDNDVNYVSEDEVEVDDDAIGINNNDDDDAAAVRSNKHQCGMMEEEDAGDKDNEEVEEEYARLSVKNKSKMSYTDVLIHFNTQFEKRASSICPNRQCDCLSILGNRNTCSSIARYFA